MDALLMRRHTAAQLLLGSHPCGAGGLLRQTAPGSRWREHGACCSDLLDRVVEHFSRQAAAHGAALCQGIIHGDANLNDAQKQVLYSWVQSVKQMQIKTPAPPADAEQAEEENGE